MDLFGPAVDIAELEMSEGERRSREQRGRAHALAFDRVWVFDICSR